MTLHRRQFLARLAAYCAAAGIPAFALADDDEHEHDDDRPREPESTTSQPALPETGLTGRVVVVGGGMAGAAVAKFLRLWGGRRAGHARRTRARYTSNILSNLVLTNSEQMSDLASTTEARVRLRQRLIRGEARRPIRLRRR